LTRRVLITGVTGNLGMKAVAALRALDDVKVIGIANDPAKVDLGVMVVFADLSVPDTSWDRWFEGVDVVLHLAADPSPVAPWESIIANNIDLSLNVLEAAHRHGVKRLVFASSNWVLAGYRFRSDPLTPATPPLPVNAYGVSKLVIERAGAALSRRGTDFLALRIGWCQPGENRPGSHMAFGRWGQQLWLSNDDWRQAVQLACTAPFDGFAVVNVMSDNAGSRWDLSETQRLLGYSPTSRHRPKLTPRRYVTEVAARVRERVFAGRTESPRFGARW
jgi:NAD+ dependent glucose-6-phosphate dehydrogenase